MKKFLLLLPFAVLLAGCNVGSPQARNDATTNQVAPTVNLALKDVIEDKAVRPAAESAASRAADKTAARVKAEVRTEMRSVQDTLSGFVTGKIEELKSLFDVRVAVTSLIRNKLIASMDAQLKNNMELIAKVDNTMQANFQNQMSFNAEMKTQLKALSDNQAALAGQVDGVTGQAGVGNEIKKTLETIQQDIQAEAGRDVNMLPPQAVEVMIDQNKTWYWTIIGIMGAIKAIALTAMLYVYRGVRQREENKTKLLMAAMGKMMPDDAEAIRAELK